MQKFTAQIDLIGINPFVFVPEDILDNIFNKAAKNKSPIPIHGTINGISYQQNLMKFKGEWRLYINTSMLKNSSKRIGEKIDVTIDFDPSDRYIDLHPKLIEALNNNKAKEIYETISPSLRKEIIRLHIFPENRRKH